MTAYIAEDREKILLWMPAETKAKAREISQDHGITITAALNILLSYGVEVHELLESQRAAATALVAATGGKR